MNKMNDTYQLFLNDSNFDSCSVSTPRTSTAEQGQF